MVNRPTFSGVAARTWRRGLALATALACAALPAFAQPAPKISLPDLQAMFDGMRTRTKWNVDAPLLWSYFFYDKDRTRLAAAGADLKTQGYTLVGITSDDDGKYRLQVDKVELHTPKSLYARNIELEALARRHRVDDYDGMEVGPVPAAHGAAASGAQR